MRVNACILPCAFFIALSFQKSTCSLERFSFRSSSAVRRHGLPVKEDTKHFHCKSLFDGWNVQEKSKHSNLNDPTGCESLHHRATKLTNDEFSICARTENNLVDEALRANNGYWTDCRRVLSVLEGFHGLTRPVQGSSKPGDLTPGASSSAPLVLDVGANIGSCTIWIAARGYRVVSFEPKPEHISMIKATAALNRDGAGSRVTLHPCGLSVDAVTNARLVSEKNNSGNTWVFLKENQDQQKKLHEGNHVAAESIGGSAPGESPEGNTISLCRLDDFCDETVEAMKVDTQGFEPFVFRGGSSMLERGAIKRIVFEFWPFGMRKRGADPESVLHFLADRGYRIFDESAAEIDRAHFPELVQKYNGTSFGDLVALHESIMTRWLSV